MILCLGTTPTVQRTMMFGRVNVDAVNRAANVIESASGKSLNVARTLRTHGYEVLATGFLGGAGGQFIRADLDRAGIPHQFIQVAPGTRTCTTVIDRSTGTATELVEETKPVEPAAYIALLALVQVRLPDADMLILSGSLPPDAPQDFYARCTRLAVAVNVPVVLDARGEPLRRALGERPTVVKPNRHELVETVGFPIDDDTSLRRAITELVKEGPTWVIITDGPGDVVASDGQSFWRITPPCVKALNPIGSGDSFAAGVAMGLLKKMELPEACRLGAACGAANALNSPAGHGTMEDAGRLAGEVVMRKM